ncbi:MAG: hypothetical protein EXQ47_09670 [Bryobacterales bacterium]|nr:hypothetical protein [Bryobacterales bacterium]
MNPAITLKPAKFGAEQRADQRQEPRRPGKGNVVVRWSNPRAQQVEGRLMDVSDNSFRMSHECSSLTAGQFVEFAHFESKGRAQVVWTRINARAVESGFVVAKYDS